MNLGLKDRKNRSFIGRILSRFSLYETTFGRQEAGFWRSFKTSTDYVP